MSLSRFIPKHFKFLVLPSFKQFSLATWTEKFKRCYSKNSLLSCMRFKFLPNDGNVQYFNFHCQKLSKNKFRFYHRWYDDFTTKRLFTIVFKRFQPSCPLCTFAAAAYSFSWEDNRISNEEIQSFVGELMLLHEQSLASKVELPKESELKNLPHNWEKVVDEPFVKIWKLPYKNSGISQYKVFGRFTDISAKQFFTVQKNVEYRRVWDKLVKDIKVVDENTETNEQVIQWIAHFPYPFNPREYVYIRKTKVDKEKNLFIIMCRSVDHSGCKTIKSHVRVPFYVSDMVIKPHKGPDEPGLDYLLTYCDNPVTHLPNRLSNWVVTVGIPDFINKLHAASLQVDNYYEKNTKISNDIQSISYPSSRTPIAAI